MSPKFLGTSIRSSSMAPIWFLGPLPIVLKCGLAWQSVIVSVRPPPAFPALRLKLYSGHQLSLPSSNAQLEKSSCGDKSCLSALMIFVQKMSSERSDQDWPLFPKSIWEYTKIRGRAVASLDWLKFNKMSTVQECCSWYLSDTELCTPTSDLCPNLMHFILVLPWSLVSP